LPPTALHRAVPPRRSTAPFLAPTHGGGSPVAFSRGSDLRGDRRGNRAPACQETSPAGEGVPELHAELDGDEVGEPEARQGVRPELAGAVRPLAQEQRPIGQGAPDHALSGALKLEPEPQGPVRYGSRRRPHAPVEGA